MPSIFLSYRRADSAGWAGRLNDSLQRLLPSVPVFMDVEDIPIGVPFDEFIGDAVSRCDLLIALIGPQWVNARDENGQRRLDAPLDYTRAEIKAALDRNIRVVPVLVGSARMPVEAELPGDLHRLAKRQNFELSDRGWEEGCQRLARAIEQGFPSYQTPSAPKKAKKSHLVPALGVLIPSVSLAFVLFYITVCDTARLGRDPGKPVAAEAQSRGGTSAVQDTQVREPSVPARPTLLDLGLEDAWQVAGDPGVFRVQRVGRDLRLSHSGIDGDYLIATMTIDSAFMRLDIRGDTSKLDTLRTGTISGTIGGRGKVRRFKRSS